jgi:hypothetical protein
MERIPLNWGTTAAATAANRFTIAPPPVIAPRTRTIYVPRTCNASSLIAPLLHCVSRPGTAEIARSRKFSCAELRRALRLPVASGANMVGFGETTYRPLSILLRRSIRSDGLAKPGTDLKASGDSIRSRHAPPARIAGGNHGEIF